ncbi:MAG: helix-turn-helix domain-containing protein [Allorhizobium sp.]
MIFVPLSFLVSLYLAVFLVRLLMRDRDTLSSHGLMLLLIAIYIVQTLLVGLRWGYGVVAVLPLLLTLASAIPPLSYLAFRDLARERQGLAWRDWPHLLPMLGIFASLMVGRDFVDLLIITEFLGYGAALLWLARLGPDGLIASRLDGVLRSYRALQLTGFALVCSAFSDVAISLDMLFSDGRHSAVVVSAATTVVLLLLGIAAVTVGSETVGEGADEETPAPGRDGQNARMAASQGPSISSEDEEVAKNLDLLMGEKKLYADAGLNLARLARRMTLPARSVSNAVNRVHGMSVSHYVNNFRIAEACRLLEQTDMAVTRIVFESGFLTKSNFNREFLRVTGKNPSRWRSEHLRQKPAFASATRPGALSRPAV